MAATTVSFLLAAFRIAVRTIWTMAARSGWSLQKMSSIGAVNGSIVRLALSTSTLCAIAQSIPQTTASGKTSPKFGSLTSSTATLTMLTLTPGATPTVPMPFLAAATIPVLNVPWPRMSLAQIAGEVLTTPPRQEALAEALT